MKRNHQKPSPNRLFRILFFTAALFIFTCAGFTSSAQNVGIGTATVTNKLNVNGNLSVGSSNIGVTAPTDGAIISGNVGIGNSSPGTYKLNVTGNTYTSGTATVVGQLTAGGNAFPTTTGTNGQLLSTNGSGGLGWTSSLDVSLITTGTLPVSRGGTGATTLTGMLKGNGTSAISAVTGTQWGAAYWADANTVSSTAAGTSGQFLMSNGAAAPTWVGAGGLSNITVYTSGSGTYTVPAGVTKLLVKIVGGGGAGGSACYSCSGLYHVGSGGGAGGYAETIITSPSTSYSYSVGTAGATYAGTTCSTTGTPLYGGNGGNTTFGSITGNGGSGGSNSINGYGLAGGAGGTATGGAINIPGSQGGYAVALSSMISGSGAASYFGGGASAGIGFTGNLSGVTATVPGSGGSGANAYSGSTWYRGGNGASGIIIIYEYK